MALTERRKRTKKQYKQYTLPVKFKWFKTNVKVSCQ